MLFHIHCVDKPDHEAIRQEHRPDHLKHLEAHAPHIWAAGPTFSEDGKTMNGSVIIVEFDTLTEAEKFVETDPFSKVKLFKFVSVRPWKQSFPKI